MLKLKLKIESGKPTRGSAQAQSEPRTRTKYMKQDMNAVAQEIAKLCPLPPTPRSLAGPGGLSPPPGPPLYTQTSCGRTLCRQTLCRQTRTPKHDPRFDHLLSRLPSPVRAMVHGLRQPSATWIRWPAAILLICGGFLSFLPILGLWMLPLGLMLLADDIAPLRSLRARMLDWIERRHPDWLIH